MYSCQGDVIILYRSSHVVCKVPNGPGHQFITSRFRDWFMRWWRDMGRTFQVLDSIDPTYHGRILQFLDRPYVDWDRASSSGSLVSMYQECAVLTVKHILDSTVRTWTGKHPDSILARNFQLSDTLEIDGVDSLDSVLWGVEAGDLSQRLSQNESTGIDWWLLKPSFGDQRDGIRLFSTRKDLENILREWEEDDDDSGNNTLRINASTLRIFVAQPYIHPPFTLDGLKLGIRTYGHPLGASNIKVGPGPVKIVSLTSDSHEFLFTSSVTSTQLGAGSKRQKLTPRADIPTKSPTYRRAFNTTKSSRISRLNKVPTRPCIHAEHI